MNRIFFSTLLFLLAAPVLARGKDILAVKSLDIPPYQQAVKGFRSAVNGEVREIILDKQNTFALRVRREKKDLIFTLGSQALGFVKEKVPHIPVIYSFVLNPGEIITDRRERRITGISMLIPPEKQFSALRQVAPGLAIKNIGVVYNPSKSMASIEKGRAAAKKLGFSLVESPVHRRGEVFEAINRLKGRVDAIWMSPDTTVIFSESIRYFLLFSFRNSVPLIGISQKYAKHGTLMALSFDNEDMGRQAGEVAERILRGEKVENIPTLEPRVIRLSINLNTAEKLGVLVPEGILKTADFVYR